MGTLISTEDMVNKVERAVQASNDVSGGEFIICARTDAAGVTGLGFDHAIQRATAYVNAGADMIFPEGLHTKEDFEKFALAMRSLRGPAPSGGPFMLANMTEFGKTPYINVQEFGAMGSQCRPFALQWVVSGTCCKVCRSTGARTSIWRKCTLVRSSTGLLATPLEWSVHSQQ